MLTISRSFVNHARTLGQHWVACSVFCLATLFIVVWSVQAIHSWEPEDARVAIVLACTLASSWILFSRIPMWIATRRLPTAVGWFLLLVITGGISAWFGDDRLASLKALGLFLITGPLIFLAARYFFEVKRNRQIFLGTVVLMALNYSLFGFFEQAGAPEIHLMTDNMLPAGSILILLLPGVALCRDRFSNSALRWALVVIALSLMVLIILIGKKGPMLALLVSLSIWIMWMFKGSRASLKRMGAVLALAGVLIVAVGFNLEKYRSTFTDLGSFEYRLENYSFAGHVFLKHPLLGVGYKGDLVRDLEDYTIWRNPPLNESLYLRYIEDHKTFENILLAFLVETGGLFFLVYFGGIGWMLFLVLKKYREEGSVVIRPVVCALVGFALLSMTYDTLRFPNLNWMFHCWMGWLMAAQSGSEPVES